MSSSDKSDISDYKGLVFVCCAGALLGTAALVATEAWVRQLSILALIAVSIFTAISKMRLDQSLTELGVQVENKHALPADAADVDRIARLGADLRGLDVALAEARVAQNLLFTKSQDVICSIDASGKFLMVSPAASLMWGYAPEELIGQSIAPLIADTSNNGADMPDSRAEHFTGQLANFSAAMAFENQFRRKDGTIVDLLWSAYWSQSEQCFCCVAHNMTEKKILEREIISSEKRIRTIMETMPLGLIMLSNDGIIEFANPAAQNMFAWSGDEFVGQNLAELFMLSSGSEPSILATGGTGLGTHVEREAHTKDGRRFFVDVLVKEFITIEGPRLLCMIIDVSQRHEIARLKQGFMEMVSHDLRTPLTTVKGVLSMLAMGKLGSLSEQEKPLVEQASQNVDRLVRLTAGLLETERLSAGTFDLNFADVSLGFILEQSLGSVLHLADEKHIHIEMPITRLQIRADADRLVQVVVNLLSNAIKFSPAESTITVLAEEHPDSVLLKVIDRGQGIPLQLQDKIFDRFQQAGSHDSRQKGGYGLGLWICQSIMQQHDGKIGVISEENKGSTFWITIPKMRATVSDVKDSHC